MSRKKTQRSVRRIIRIAAPMLAIVGIILIGAHTILAKHTPIVGTTYYVSASGNDKSDGHSPQTAWKTMSRVNSIDLHAGDSILFHGGDTFTGRVYVPPKESGTTASPITVSSYGTGHATIDGGTQDAIYVYDASGIKITDLTLIGSGASKSTGAGIDAYNDLPKNATLNYLYIADVTVNGFLNGISIGGAKGASGYSNVTVTHATLFNNARAGLQTYGPAFNAAHPTYANKHIYVSYVDAYNNLGDPHLTGSSDSGNGIVLGSVDTATIEYSSAHDNGAACVASSCGIGIWSYNSNGITIQHDLSYENHTGSTADGDGFDLDQNTSNSIMQYNYAYDNDGAGYLLFGVSNNQAHVNNTVRFNISQNDGRKNSYGGIVIYGNVSKDAIYNNTVYIASSAGADTPSAIKILSVGAGTTTVRNNIFETPGGLFAVVVGFSPKTTSLDFQQNDYYPSNIYWGTASYTVLSDWQAATGQEKINGQASGLMTDPGLLDAGNAPAITQPNGLAELTQYQLSATQSVKNKGLNLASRFNINIGKTDFYGAAVPAHGGLLSIGAAE